MSKTKIYYYKGYEILLYGNSSESIRDSEGNEIFHTGSRRDQCLEDIKNTVDYMEDELWKN